MAYVPIGLEMADVIGRVLGRPAAYVPITDEEFAEFCAQISFKEHFVQHSSKLGADVRNGITIGTAGDVETLTGIAPLSAQDFVERNKDRFRQ